MTLECKKNIVVALDYASADEAVDFARQLDPARCRVKVGKELFTRAGPVVVERLQQANFDVFLDLKFHDIPNTVAAACKVGAELGVWMLNVHCSGGSRMMMAAREAVAACSHQPLLIGVTVLTSMSADDLKEIGITLEPAEQVKRLAALAKRSGLSGLVCSAQEAQALKQEFGSDFVLVTPGVRPLGSAQGDQQRVMTPSAAVAAGADYLVIGRPITQAADPAAAFEAIWQELNHSVS